MRKDIKDKDHNIQFSMIWQSIMLDAQSYAYCKNR